MMAPFHVVIPARYGSTRLPGKPLRLIAGRPMIQHVWERAQESGCAEAIVATDDERIREAVEAFGGRAVMTSSEHQSGTDRIAEVASKLGFADDDIIVNLQGDEPSMPGALVRHVAEALAERPNAGMATLAAPIRRVTELFDPNVVKVVLDESGFALYFSRAPIPWVRGVFSTEGAVNELPDGVPFLRHLGLYAYRTQTLRAISSLLSVRLENAEALEQLRALSHSVSVRVSIVRCSPGGVDTEDDLVIAETQIPSSAAG